MWRGTREPFVLDLVELTSSLWVTGRLTALTLALLAIEHWLGRFALDVAAVLLAHASLYVTLQSGSVASVVAVSLIVLSAYAIVPWQRERRAC